MLTYDSLVEQAKSRDMPPAKMRGVLREYLQTLILKELYRTDAGKKLYFTGGTYLRLICNNKRFSEDLDFNTNKITKKEFENLLEKTGRELKRTGLESRVKFTHWGNVYVSQLTFPDIERIHNITSKYSKKEGIIIKVETNKAKWKIENEVQVISAFGEFYPCICTMKSILFADKIDAFIKKKRGRHLYDIIFMLSSRYPVDKSILMALGIKEDPLDVISDSVGKTSKKELKRQAETLRPFLFDESGADLIANAHNIVPSLIEQYKAFIKKEHRNYNIRLS